MSDPAAPPRRVRVTRPSALVAPPPIGVAREIDEQTALGEVYVRSLVRSQLRLALVVLGVLGIALGGLPLLFDLFPESGRVHLFGVPLPWLVLGGLVYPALVAVGWFYVRQAERNEREFSDLVDRR
jgi:hypothetical protein